MTEWRLFREGTVPEFTTAEWYRDRERAPHLEQGDHRFRLLRTVQLVLDAVYRYPGGLVDLGCGDGGLLSLLPAGTGAWGYDLCPDNVRAATEVRKAWVRLLDVVAEPDKVEWAPVAVMTEMLEHLADPHGYLAALPPEVRAFVASSPRTETADNHYEFHAWAWDMDGYAAMAARAGFRVIRHEAAGPYQIILAEREDA